VLDYVTNWLSGRRSVGASPKRKTQKAHSAPFTATRGGRAPQDELSYQQRLDKILDKIKDSGYESLSVEEKEFLYNASKK
jgi:hypothetical protein